MEVLLLYHFSGHMNCGDISPYIGLKQMVGTSVLNRFLAVAWPLIRSVGFQDVKEAINNLESWSRAKKVPTPLALQPASCYVQAQPKGVT